MSPPDEQGRLTVGQAVGRFRAQVVAELRALNEHLPRSRRLERAEINRLADDLLFAIRKTPKRRNASLLDKAIWIVGGVLVQAIRRRRKPTGGAVLRTRKAGDEREISQAGVGAPRARLNHAGFEAPGSTSTD